ncbi:MAG: UvrB/UvrC motif-containing protein [Clostridia bacterium]|nr:UvrB/UvrC motif-containing protein [Clostridia bacterium]
MLCEKCGKNMATTHIHSVVNGVAREMYLCDECAAKEGISMADSGFSNMLASMLGDTLSIKKQGEQTRCKCCGSTFSDIAEKGVAGCPECYKEFYNEFLPYIKRVHGSVKHIGKNIGASSASQQEGNKVTIESLRDELAKLISEEKFELAAEVRDKIKEMEAQK